MFVLRQIIEKRLKVDRETHLAFIDLEKAYDSVPRNKLWKILTEIGLNKTLIRIMQLMYKESTAQIKIGNKLHSKFKTSKGLRQGCSISPTLFNLYVEHVIRLWKKKCEKMGIWIRESYLSTISFADDQVLIAQDEDDLSYMIRKLNEYYTTWGLQISLEKTEYMVIGNKETPNLQMEENEIKGVNEFKYLGTIFDKNGSIESEIKRRINQGRVAVRMLNGIWWDEHITRTTKVMIYRSIVESILTYGAEVWTMSKAIRSKLLATEMDALRRSMRKSRLERIRNEFIRHEMDALETVVDRILQKGLTWYGHVNRMPEDRWPKQLFQWVPFERNKRGRPRKSWKKEMQDAMQERDLQEEAWNDREEWQKGVKRKRRQS